MTTVLFAHGKESGPTGRKIEALGRIAQEEGYQTLSPDYRDLRDPEARVERLLGIATGLSGACVLVGSSMGGYTSLVASSQLPACCGLFLLAPAIGLAGYAVNDPACPSCPVEIVHGWHDDIVPVNNVVSWARRHATTLHLVNDGHRLETSLGWLVESFRAFLRRL